MLSGREQEWVLRELIEGKSREVDAEAFTGYRRGCLEVILAEANGKRQLALLEYLSERYENGRELYKGLVEAPRPESASFRSYADLNLPPIEWFWKGWIANGLLSILAAAPGTGKSLIAQDLAARVIAGQEAPDGSELGAVSNRVIYVDAENVPRITLERGRKWRMDLSQMYPLLPRPYQWIDFESLEDRDRLIEMAHTLAPGLIVVDSLSMISSRGDSNVEEVRPVLAFLANLCEDVGCATVLVHHTRKRMANVLPGMELTMDDVRGSGQILAAGRTILGLSIVQTGPEADLNGPRELSVLKTNLGRAPEPIGCTFVPFGEDGVRVQYGEKPKRWQEPTEADRCKEWLLALLESEGEPMKPKAVVEAAEGAGFSRATVYKARRELAGRIENTAGARSPNNEWVLVAG